MRPKARPFVVALVLVLSAVACGGEGREDEGAGAPAAPTEETQPLVDVATVTAAFGPEIESLGLRVTRAGLTDRPSDARRYGSGDHLAIYLEPLEASTPQQYLDRLAPLVELFVPAVFDRTPSIRSFDVCQEPLQAEDPATEPVPVTAFLVERSAVDDASWTDLDLKTVIRMAKVAPTSMELVVSPEMLDTPAWTSALRAATG